MVKAILGIVLSIGIVIGSVKLVDELDLLRTDAMYDDLRACSEASTRPGGEHLNCWQRFGEQTDAADGNEMLLGAGIGIAIVGLGWLLAWLFYIRPRRRREEAADAAW
jgi:hypothetical protein